MSSPRLNQAIGKRAIATLLSATMLASGVVVVNTTIAPSAFAMEKTWNQESGTGDVHLEGQATDQDPAITVKPGATVVVNGTDLEPNQTYTIKIDDGALKLANNQVDKQLTYNDRGFVQLTSSAKGTLMAKIVLPADIAAGEHDVRLLGQGSSHFATFNVEDEKAMESGKDNAPANSSAAEVMEVSTSYENSAFVLDNSVEFKAKGFKPGSKVTGWIGGEQVQFSTEWYAPKTNELTANEKGAVQASFSVPAKFAVAGVEQTIKLKDSEGTAAMTTFTIKDTPAFIHKSKMPLANAAQGNRNEVVVSNLPEGSTITYVGTEDMNFLPAGKTFAASADHTAVATDVLIPADEKLVGKEVIVKVTVNGEERTVKTETLVTVNDQAGSEVLKKAELPAGLYIPAFSKKHNALYVTRSFLGIGTKEGPAAQILKVDADSLKVIKAQDAPAAQGFPPAYAAFGIDIDEANDRVWVTNSLQATVAVYSANDLKLIKQFKPEGKGGLQTHAHELKVDPKSGNVFVTGFDERHPVLVIDGKTLEPVANNPEIPGLEKSVGLDFDSKTGNLYVVRFAFSPGSNPAVFRYNVNTKKTDKVALADTDLRATNISVDEKTGLAFVTLQQGNQVAVVDFDKGTVVHRINTDAKPVYLEVDSDSRLVYVGNRDGKTLTAYNADTYERVSNTDVGTYPNGIALDGKGGAYVVNMKNQIDHGLTDEIFHVAKPAPVNPAPVNPNEGSMKKGDAIGSFGGSSGLSALATIIPIVLTLVGLGFLYDWIQKHPMPGFPALPPLPKIG